MALWESRFRLGLGQTLFPSLEELHEDGVLGHGCTNGVHPLFHVLLARCLQTVGVVVPWPSGGRKSTEQGERGDAEEAEVEGHPPPPHLAQVCPT